MREIEEAQITAGANDSASAHGSPVPVEQIGPAVVAQSRPGAVTRQRSALTEVSTWHTFGVLFSRDLKNLFINPAWVSFNTAFPLVLILVLGYLTKGNYGGMGVTSFDFYGVTLLLFSSLSVAMTSSNSFMERGIMASNLRVLYAPVRPSSVYLSKIVATWLFTSVCFSAIVAVLHFWLGVDFGGKLFGYVATIVLLLGLFSSAVGVMFCCLLRSEELANKVVSPVSQVMAIVGGLFFPLDGFSETMARISWYSPAKWVAEAVFRIIYDGDLAMFLPAVLILSVATVAALIGCKLTFRTEDYV